jgi:XTP/dITP diphosphohydrolase
VKVVLATGNPHKVAEIRDFVPQQISLISQGELNVSPAEETGLTFVENAILKARHAAIETGLPAMADDSGLEVNYLNGAPGVRSARYAGEQATDLDNNLKLMKAMQHAPMDQRDACFHCVIVFLKNALDPVPIIASGRWRGQILQQPRGTNGFGYDPLFFLPDLKCSAAQLSTSDKVRQSHRGKALQELHRLLQ